MSGWAFQKSSDWEEAKIKDNPGRVQGAVRLMWKNEKVEVERSLEIRKLGLSWSKILESLNMRHCSGEKLDWGERGLCFTHAQFEVIKLYGNG